MPAAARDSTDTERAAMIALLRCGARSWNEWASLVEEAGSAVELLEQELGLLAGDQLDRARAEVDGWRASGMRLITVLDSDYPENLRAVHDRPPLVFVSGRLEARDGRSLAVVGARSASPNGTRAACAIATHLVENGYTVVSGLAAGIDTAAHTTALQLGGRTLAVIGTGLKRVYPPQNAELQRTIASRGAVISQFWPDSPPSRRSFPMRNAVMSGIALGSVIVEASHTSGSRLQARLALAQARPVFLLATLLTQQWARELSLKPGAHVVHSPQEITRIVERLTSSDSLTG